ncbi:MAG: hypothetical protein RBG13Loki_2603 [Promethearchaeota archaeon CR_4]|nr:MAG: hypothetical protein RBG13Loki_2603 [Candidatus Lokiarchaeota archaeon CR_4]
MSRSQARSSLIVNHIRPILHPEQVRVPRAFEVGLDGAILGGQYFEMGVNHLHARPLFGRVDRNEYQHQNARGQRLFEEELAWRDAENARRPAQLVNAEAELARVDTLFRLLNRAGTGHRDDFIQAIEITDEYRETTDFRGRSQRYQPMKPIPGLERARQAMQKLLPAWSPIFLSRVKEAADRFGIWKFLSNCRPFPRLSVHQGRQLLARLPSPDVAYYLANFGFDPRQKVLLDEGGSYYYEAELPLAKDVSLHEAGVSVAARVYVTGKQVSNNIVFKYHGKEGMVECVHTAICDVPAGGINNISFEKDIIERARSLEQAPASAPRLSPEDHFVSLRSYVAGIAEMGIVNVARASYLSEGDNPLTLPFGFNAMMQSQVFQALARLSPRASRRLALDHLLFLLESVPDAWLAPRFSTLAWTYGFEVALLGDLLMFTSIFEEFPRPWLAHWALSRAITGPIAEYLATKGFYAPQGIQPITVGTGAIPNAISQAMVEMGHQNAAINHLDPLFLGIYEFNQIDTERRTQVSPKEPAPRPWHFPRIRRRTRLRGR